MKKNFERHVGRFLALIPQDSRTVDSQPLAKRLVSVSWGSYTTTNY